MEQEESKKLINTLKIGDDDVFIKKKEEIFCFETISQKQKSNLFMCSKRKDQKVIENNQETEQKQQLINTQINFYEELSLVECYVNIFAMKKFIKNNIKSLRIIEIIMCYFYLSDEEAKTKNKEYLVKNQRMFEELKFDWLIEQFKFKNIQTITIQLQKDPDESKQNSEKPQNNQPKSTKVSDLPTNQEEKKKKKKQYKEEQLINILFL